MTLSARRGASVFRKAECDTCHPAPAYTRPLRFDVGTGGTFDVPTLLGVSTTGPWGHDGRWDRLDEAVDAILANRDVELTEAERRQLVEYLKLL